MLFLQVDGCAFTSCNQLWLEGVGEEGRLLENILVDSEHGRLAHSDLDGIARNTVMISYGRRTQRGYCYPGRKVAGETGASGGLTAGGVGVDILTARTEDGGDRMRNGGERLLWVELRCCNEVVQISRGEYTVGARTRGGKQTHVPFTVAQDCSPSSST